MNKIINGKVYNTDTARKIGTWSNGADRTDFSWVEESLYQKKTGEFFLHGQGGPDTRYAQQLEASHWAGGETISLVSYDSARQWADDHLTADQYQAVFGEVAEDDSRTTLLLSLPVATVKKIKRNAAQAGLTVSAYIESKIKL